MPCPKAKANFKRSETTCIRPAPWRHTTSGARYSQPPLPLPPCHPHSSSARSSCSPHTNAANGQPVVRTSARIPGRFKHIVFVHAAMRSIYTLDRILGTGRRQSRFLTPSGQWATGHSRLHSARSHHGIASNSERMRRRVRGQRGKQEVPHHRLPALQRRPFSRTVAPLRRHSRNL